MRRDNHPSAEPSAFHPFTTRKTVYWATLTSLVVAAAACVGQVPDEDEIDVGVAQSALVSGESNVNPVVVTSGTCLSNGYQPIYTLDGCARADAILFANKRFTSGQLDTPAAYTSTGSIDSSDGLPDGCTAGTLAPPATEGDPSELGTYFLAPNVPTETLEAQACSHHHPCVCNDVDEDPDALNTSACRDGVFEPNPNKYYTIRSPNGRHLRTVGRGDQAVDRLNIEVIYTPKSGDARQPYTHDYNPNAAGVRGVEYIHTPSDVRFHWRFAASSGGYRTVSRDAGKALNAPFFPTFELAAESDAGPFTFTCRGSQVVMEQNGASPIDSGGLFVDSNAAFIVGSPAVRARPASPGSMYWKSGCVKKSRSCQSMFGPGFEQVGRHLCGIVNQNHVLTCRNTLDVPVSMHLPQAWYIEEVHDFKRAVDFDVDPVTVAPVTSTSAVGDSVATFGLSAASALGGAGAAIFTDAKVLALSGPAFGAVASLGLGFLPGGAFDFNKPDPVAELAGAVQDALDQLAIDMTAQTTALIANTSAQEDAQKLADAVKSRREDFYVTYIQHRRPFLTIDDISDASALTTDVRVQADGYDGNIDLLFPDICPRGDSGCQVGEDLLRRAHFGLAMAKLAVSEAMTIRSEAALMKALADDSLSCEEALSFNSLEFHADKYARMLQHAVDELVAYGRASSGNRVNRSADEFEFDARNFSYNIQPQRVFLNQIVAATQSKCRRMRDSASAFRQHYIENTPAPLECHGDLASGDSDGSGTCDDVVAALATPWTEVATVGSLAGASKPSLEDIDSDGDLDLVTRHHNQRRLVQWDNVGGALVEGPSLSTPCKPIGFDLADFNGDGYLDVATGGNSSNHFVVAQRDGADFGAKQSLLSGVAFRQVLSMPVDGDDRPDLVAFDASNQQLVSYLNASDVTGLAFAAATVIDNVSSNAFDGPGLAPLDVDADGDLDLIVATGELALYENVGGSFVQAVVIDNVNIGSTIVAADLDRDGDDDLLGRFGGRAVWYENLGDGDFRAQQAVAANAVSAFAVGDVDLDGDDDVILRDRDSGEVIWVENGNLGLIVRAPIGNAPGSFTVGDIDGDGDADVVATDPANNGLITFLNPLL